MDPDKINDHYTDSDPEEDNNKSASVENAHASASDTASASPRKTISFDTPEESDRPVTPVKKRHPVRKFFIWLIVIAVIVLTAAMYIRYFNPYVSDAKVTGYITNVERRGVFFKTYEGEMISRQKLTDPNHIYSRDFYFTVPSDSLARVLQGMQGTGHPVTLIYDRYWGMLPWRGGSTIVITGIDKEADNQD